MSTLATVGIVIGAIALYSLIGGFVFVLDEEYNLFDGDDGLATAASVLWPVAIAFALGAAVVFGIATGSRAAASGIVRIVRAAFSATRRKNNIPRAVAREKDAS